MELKCVVDFYAPENITEVVWAWGDGNTQEVVAGDPGLLEGTHSFTETGNYNVKMCVKFTADGRESSHCADRRSYVRACGEPEAAFSYNAVDTRTLQFVNLTDIKAYGCIFDVEWEVYEGDSVSGTPVDTLKAWAPEYEFPSAGNYTVVLNVGGIGGTGAAVLPINVGQATRGANSCDTLGGSAGFVLALSGLAALRRRRV
jgi:PKD repeat protein